MKTHGWIIVLVVVLLLAVAITTAITKNAVNWAWCKEAIEEGHAEYYLDHNYPYRHWRWLPAPSEKGETR